MDREGRSEGEAAQGLSALRCFQKSNMKLLHGHRSLTYIFFKELFISIKSVQGSTETVPEYCWEMLLKFYKSREIWVVQIHFWKRHKRVSGSLAVLTETTGSLVTRKECFLRCYRLDDFQNGREEHFLNSMGCCWWWENRPRISCYIIRLLSVNPDHHG